MPCLNPSITIDCTVCSRISKTRLISWKLCLLRSYLMKWYFTYATSAQLEHLRSFGISLTSVLAKSSIAYKRAATCVQQPPWLDVQLHFAWRTSQLPWSRWTYTLYWTLFIDECTLLLTRKSNLFHLTLDKNSSNVSFGSRSILRLCAELEISLLSSFSVWKFGSKLKDLIQPSCFFSVTFLG